MTPLFRLMTVLLLLLAFTTVTVADPPKDEPKVKLTEEEQAILDLTNKEREKEKLPPLKFNPVLTECARAHSKNMAKQNKFEHELDGKKPSDRVTAFGYDWSWVGENIGMSGGNAPEAVMRLWMNSPGHKENILKDKFEEIGIGIAKSDKGEYYFTQVFGTAVKKK
jgi:uncharacterized protein YkwD